MVKDRTYDLSYRELGTNVHFGLRKFMNHSTLNLCNRKPPAIEQPYWYHLIANGRDFNIRDKLLKKYAHIRKSNFEVTIKIKLKRIFYKISQKRVFLR